MSLKENNSIKDELVLCKRCNKHKVTINDFCDKCFKSIFEKKIFNSIFNLPFKEVIFYDNNEINEIIAFYVNNNIDKIKYILKSKKENQKLNKVHDKKLIFLTRNDFIIFYLNLFSSKKDLITISQNKNHSLNVNINDDYNLKYFFYSPFEKITEKEISYFSNKFLKNYIYNLNDFKKNLSSFCENVSFYDKKEDIKLFKDAKEKNLDKITNYLEESNDETLYSFIASIDKIRDLL